MRKRKPNNTTESVLTKYTNLHLIADDGLQIRMMCTDLCGVNYDYLHHKNPFTYFECFPYEREREKEEKTK